MAVASRASMPCPSPALPAVPHPALPAVPSPALPAVGTCSALVRGGAGSRAEERSHDYEKTVLRAASVIATTAGWRSRRSAVSA